MKIITSLQVFTRMSRNMILVLGFAGVMVLGWIDYATGYELSFSIFYVIPIVVVGWHAGHFPAMLMSLFSAVVWLVADILSGHQYSHYLIPVWNTVMRLGFYVIITHFLSVVWQALDHEKELARVDSLTGAANTRYFYDVAASEISRMQRFKRPFSIAYIDVDQFKWINDTLGHKAGDDFLQVMVKVIRNSIRKIDMVARLGGDEFALLLPETDENQVKIVIGRVQANLLSAVKQNKDWPVSFSVGVITCKGGSRDLNEMIKIADDLMYSVKKSGKNAVQYVIEDQSAQP